VQILCVLSSPFSFVHKSLLWILNGQKSWFKEGKRGHHHTSTFPKPFLSFLSFSWCGSAVAISQAVHTFVKKKGKNTLGKKPQTHIISFALILFCCVRAGFFVLRSKTSFFSGVFRIGTFVFHSFSASGKGRFALQMRS